MYKIIINDRPLVVCASTDVPQVRTGASSQLVARYSGKVKTILHYVDLLEKASPRVSEVLLHSAEPERLWHDFQAHYQIVEAAGGLVVLPDGRWLLIFRRGHWDLPKGKIDAGESIPEAAVREVIEETGVQHPILGDLLTVTYHTYRDRKDVRTLKPTHWFWMQANQEALIPQTEEDIEQARWIIPEQIANLPEPMYLNIRDLLELALREKKTSNNT